MKLKAFLLLGLVSLSLSASAQKTMNLWQSGAPNSNGDSTDIPTIRVYLPNAKSATGRAVVICPGGGYAFLAMDHEGNEWASFFNKMGIAAIVLKYRMPHGNCEVPETDAEEAIRQVRAHAAEWHIDPQQVGIMGSSAGGHLASTVATHAKPDVRPNCQILFYPVISMDPALTHRGSHDGFLGKNPEKGLEDEFSNEKQVRAGETPPAIMLLSDDDNV